MSQIDLSGLKDIIIPVKPDVFPLAIGWWIVILGGIIVLLTGIGLFLHHYFSPLTYAYRELDKLKKRHKTQTQLAKEISKLLKRAAILRFSAEKVASLCDETWERFLSAEAHAKITPDVIKFIAYATYLPDNEKSTIKISALYKAGRLLLKNILKDKNHDYHHNL